MKFPSKVQKNLSISSLVFFKFQIRILSESIHEEVLSRKFRSMTKTDKSTDHLHFLNQGKMKKLRLEIAKILKLKTKIFIQFLINLFPENHKTEIENFFQFSLSLQ